MTTTYGVELFKGTETSFVAANRKFFLDATSMEISDTKSIEPFEIPSLIWNDVFDSSIVSASWTIRGKFSSTDKAWSGQPNFEGRGFDFMHELRSLLKGISSTTGTYDSTGDLDKLIMVVSRNANESYNTFNKYSTDPEDPTTPIYVIANRFNFNFKGGLVGTVDYSVTFSEVSGVIRI